jgi:hypothetical protein
LTARFPVVRTTSALTLEYRQQRLDRRRRNAGVLVERELILGDRREVDFENLRADLFGLGVDRLARLGVEFAAAGGQFIARCFKRPLRRADRVIPKVMMFDLYAPNLAFRLR